MRDPSSLLLELSESYRHRSRCPYSEAPQAAVALLRDGTCVPGVRVESASFSLVIDAAVNAVSTAAAAGRTDIVAIALSSDASASQSAYLEHLGLAPLTRQSTRLFTGHPPDTLPPPGDPLDPAITLPETETERIESARAIAARAHIPESSFPVGCLAVTTAGTVIPGVNVEHPDWNRILCAERNAVGTAVTYGLGRITHLYLSCPLDADGTPCGACRQVLAELAPGSTIVMDRNPSPPVMTTPEALLPGSFTGSALLKSRATHRT